ncbi:MAG: hypothetical protein NC209_03905 [Alistipes sp.]|nr:hypothetical protein [Lachnospiraceae bacterium]MCM1250276.1 hypothetical protein [Alistipes sp.]
MKQKIKEAIQQGYKNLGVPESVVDGLTALGETVVKDESEIEAFVQSEAVKGVMKSYQSEADKVRTEYSAKLKELEKEKAELEAKLNNGNPTNPEPPKPTEQPDFKAMLAEALAEVVNPLKEELATFKATEAAKSALLTAESTFKSNDYVKKYADEATDAWERATEMYEATGKAWTADELQAKAMGYFNNLVKRKGVDTTKPFGSDGGSSKEEPDFGVFDKAAANIDGFKPDQK